MGGFEVLAVNHPIVEARGLCGVIVTVTVNVDFFDRQCVDQLFLVVGGWQLSRSGIVIHWLIPTFMLFLNHRGLTWKVPRGFTCILSNWSLTNKQPRRLPEMDTSGVNA